jgi:hypothetical protein
MKRGLSLCPISRPVLSAFSARGLANITEENVSPKNGKDSEDDQSLVGTAPVTLAVTRGLMGSSKKLVTGSSPSGNAAV